MVAHTCNPGTQEAEAIRSLCNLGQPDLQRETRIAKATQGDPVSELYVHSSHGQDTGFQIFVAARACVLVHKRNSVSFKEQMHLALSLSAERLG